MSGILFHLTVATVLMVIIACSSFGKKMSNQNYFEKNKNAVGHLGNRRSGGNCQSSSAQLFNCRSVDVTKKEFHFKYDEFYTPQNRYHIYLLPNKNCEPDEMKIEWYIIDVENGRWDATHLPHLTNSANFTFDYFNYLPQTSVIRATGNAGGNEWDYHCILKIRKEPPVAYISGYDSYLPDMHSWSSVLMGNYSIDYTAPQERKSLSYEWDCHFDDRTVYANYCATVSFEPGAITNFERPPSYITSPNVSELYPLYIQLQVKSRYGEFSKFRAKAVLDQKYQLMISEIKNAMLKIDNTDSIIVGVRCTNCPPNTEYTWSVSGGITLSPTSVQLRNNRRLVIRRNQDKMKSFSITLKAGSHTEVTRTMSAYSMPEAKCNFEKKTDIVFEVSCTIPPNAEENNDIYGWRIIQEKPAETTLYWMNYRQAEVILSRSEESSAVIKFVMVDLRERLSSFGTAEVTMESPFASLSAEDQFNGIISVYEGKNPREQAIRDLVEKQDTDGATQIINNLVGELNFMKEAENKTEDLIKVNKFKLKIMEDLAVLNFEITFTSLLQVIGVIRHLNVHSTKKNMKYAYFTEASAILSKRVAEGGYLRIQGVPNPTRYQSQMIHFVRQILFTIVTNSVSNPYVMVKGETKTNDEVVGDVVMEDRTENYAIYDEIDSEMQYMLLAYGNSARIIMETMVPLTRILIHTAMNGDDDIVIEEEDFTLQLISDDSDIVPTLEVKGNGFRVSLTEKVKAHSSQSMHFLVIAFKNDHPFWFDPSSVDVSLPILFVNVFFDESPMGLREGAVKLVFDVKTRNITITEHKAHAPQPMRNWTPKVVNDFMTVHRIEVIHGAGLIFAITDFADDEILQRPAPFLLVKVKNVGYNADELVQHENEITTIRKTSCTSFGGMNTQQPSFLKTWMLKRTTVPVSMVRGLHVVPTFNRRPHASDFNSSEVLRVDKRSSFNIVVVPDDLIGDSWVYIAVRPSPDMMTTNTKSEVTIKYRISFKVVTCAYWSIYLDMWLNDGCILVNGTSLKEMHCVCHHHSAYVGVSINPPIKEIRPMKLSFTIPPNPSNIIFAMVCAIAVVYCMLLCCGVHNETTLNERVYYLADNIPQDCYAYMVCVKTGIYNDAGTTSNIGLVLTGENCKSKTHVINYPDPEMRLLQKDQEDWFVLTTEDCMGEIKEICLWHDSIGARPSWYCDWVSVVDMQSKAEYQFDVRTWFSVLKKEQRPFCAKVLHKKLAHADKIDFLARLLDAAKDHTWNFCQTFQYTDLTYFQRSTVILSIFLITYSLALGMWGIPKLRNFDILGIGHVSLSYNLLATIVFSSLTSFLLHVSIVLMFRRAYYKNMYAKVSQISIVVPWVLLVTAILGSLTFLIIYGFWVPYVSGLLCLVTSTVALVQIMIVLETFHVILKDLIFEGKRKTPPRIISLPAIVYETEEQQKSFFDKFGPYLLRPFFTEKYSPLSKEEWLVKKEKESTKRKYARLVTDALLLVMYILTLSGVIWTTRSSVGAYGNRHLRDVISGKALMPFNQFKDVRKIQEFYDYINETLKPMINANKWYDGWRERNPGLIADFNTKVLGIGRVRQHRVSGECLVNSHFANFKFVCRPEYSSRARDEGEYADGWGLITAKDLPSFGSWQYLSKGWTLEGQFQTYPAGGYVALLPREPANWGPRLQFYNRSKWIDPATRMVVVEFLAYNAFANIFHTVTFLMEKSATGLFTETEYIYTMQLLQVNTRSKIIVFVAFLGFLLLTVVLLIRNCVKAYRYTREYLTDFWCILDGVMVTVSLMAGIVFMIRHFKIKQLLLRMSNSRQNVFLKYDDVQPVEKSFTLILGILICLATVKVLTVLKLRVITQRIEKTMSSLHGLLVCLIMVHFFCITTFAVVGYLLFGSHVGEFRTVTSSFITLCLWSASFLKVDFYSFLMSNFLVLPFYGFFMSFTLILTSLYIVATLNGYRYAKMLTSTFETKYKFAKYLEDELKFKIGLMRKHKKKRLRGGGPTNSSISKVKQKPDDIRYARAFIISDYRLYVMSLVARFTIIKSSKERTRNDLLNHCAFHILTDQDVSSPKYIVYLTQEVNRTIVEDHRFLQMEYVVDYILNKGTEENSESGDVEKFASSCNESLEFVRNSLDVILELFNHISVSEIV